MYQQRTPIIAVDVSLLDKLHFSVEYLARGRTVTEPLPTRLVVCRCFVARVCEVLCCGLGLFVERGSGHSGIKRHRPCPTGSKGAGSQKCPRLLERHVPPLRAMDEILCGTNWRMISPLLTTDDVVWWRTVTGRWSVGSRYGKWAGSVSCSYVTTQMRNVGITIRHATRRTRC